MKKRALVVGAGVLRGAYDAGVALTLCRELGPDYFEAIYAVSAGAYTAAHIALNQPDTGEDLWRNYLDGSKFINFLSPLRNRPICNLEYLTHLLKRKETRLRIENIFSIPTILIYVLTDSNTGVPVYMRPTRENILDLMAASSATPLAHPQIVINGVSYIDGVLSDPLPFSKALEDGYEEVVVVYNKPRGFLVGSRYDAFVDFIGACVASKTTARLIRTLKLKLQEIDRQFEHADNNRLKIIRPKTQLPLKSIFDSNKARLNACVDMGIADAKEFLKTYLLKI